MAAAMTVSPTAASYAMEPPPTTRSKRSASQAMPPPPSAMANNADKTNNTIRTPLSSTYPNHIHSPLRSSAHKRDSSDNIKTPLTPPSAYFDFLRILSPNPYTPSPLSTGTSTRFSHDSNYPSPAWPSAGLRDEKHLLRPTISSARSTSSSASGSSFSSGSSGASSAALSAAAGHAASSRDRASAPPPPVANSSKPLQRPSELAFGRSHSAPEHRASDITTTTITATDPSSGTRTTEITRPHTARPALQPGTPRLVIPPSPSGSVTQLSPAQHSAPATTANVPHSACPPSAMSAHGAQSANMRSAGGWTPASAVSRENLWAKAASQSAGAPPSANPTSANGTTASPGPWQRGKSPSASNNSSPVTIKHVVTRTVTYHRRSNGPPVQGPARQGVGAAAARAVAQSPLSAVEAIPEEEEEKKCRPLVGEVPRGKRRRVE
ncbi:MAG: hypothetical protein Q9162_007883 [Coniocarpon cinnabarinum]